MLRTATACATILLAFPLLAQNPALDRLNSSPRHHEWVGIEGPDRTIHTFVVYPEVRAKVPVVVVIHENRGLNDWARSLADQLAEAGYIAVAPDFLSGMGPDDGNTAAFADSNAARDAIYELTTERVMMDLEAVVDWAAKLPATDGRMAVAGFCWGGLRAFQFAAENDDILAAFVFYGTPPEPDKIREIAIPVFGFYGGNDARVTSTVDETIEQMKHSMSYYAPVIYEGAGHGFMRSGEEPDADPANVAARERAWKRWLTLLEKL